MYTWQKIIKFMYGNRAIRPKPPKVKTLPIVYSVASALSDFPIYIKPSAIAGWWALTLAEAQSLRFYDENENELPREIVSADEIYVKKSLTSWTGNKLLLEYDWVSPDYADNDDFGKYNTWNSNILLRHNYLKWSSVDSTRNQYNWINTNVSFTSDWVAMSNSWKSLIGITNSGQFSFNGKPFSVVMMIKPNTWSPTSCTLIDFEDGGWRWWLLRKEGSYNYLSWRQDQQLSNWRPSTWAWTLVVFTSNWSNWKVYYNWSLNYTQWSLNYWTNSTSTYWIGCNYENNTQSFDGSIKYIWILNTELSTNRISTEYANQSNPATFFGTLS